MKEIPLGKGLFALVDDGDYDWLSQKTWRVSQRPSGKPYARHSTWENGKVKAILMHRLILGAEKGTLVDHINGDSLDNRRCNLRFCTATQNNWNRRPRSKSGYKGVFMAGDVKPRTNPWKAEIICNSRRYTIGFFPTKEEAARAYDARAKELFGEFAYLNFPLPHAQ